MGIYYHNCINLILDKTHLIQQWICSAGVETVSGRSVVTLSGEAGGTGGAGGAGGEQELELTYNGALVAGAPRRALLAPPASADRVTLAGRGLAHASPHSPAVFTIGLSYSLFTV